MMSDACFRQVSDTVIGISLRSECLAAFTFVVTFFDDVDLVRSLQLSGRLHGFFLRWKGFPIEGRLGCPANMVVNTQLHRFYFALRIRPEQRSKLTESAVLLRSRVLKEYRIGPEIHTSQKIL